MSQSFTIANSKQLLAQQFPVYFIFLNRHDSTQLGVKEQII